MSRNLLILSSVVLVFAVFTAAKPKPNCIPCPSLPPQYYPQQGYGPNFYPANGQQFVGGDLGAYAANLQIPHPLQQVQMPQPIPQVQLPQSVQYHVQQVPVQQPQMQVQQVPVQQFARYELPPQYNQIGLAGPQVNPAPCNQQKK